MDQKKIVNVKTDLNDDNSVVDVKMLKGFNLKMKNLVLDSIYFDLFDNFF